MPVRKSSRESSSHCLRVAGLILRRNPEREFHSYLPLLPYQPNDYQILLRTLYRFNFSQHIAGMNGIGFHFSKHIAGPDGTRWPTAPFKGYLGTFSGPTISGQDPPETLVRETYNWTRRLTQQATVGEDAKGVSVRRAEFISIHGGGRNTVDAVSGHQLDIGITLCYVLPTTTRESSVVTHYPTTSDYPQFYDLSAVLQGMMSSETLNVHPFTREMLSALDRWLRERHALTGAINLLFSPSLESRLKMYVSNPLHCPPSVSTSNHDKGEGEIGTTNVTVTGHPPWPLSSSTPFQRPSDDSTRHETTAFSVAKLSDSLLRLDHEPADVVVKNPLFGSGLEFKKVDMMVVNRYFGRGVPDYDSLLGEKRGKWSIQVEGDGLPDWVDLFPMHKCACEGDGEGVRRCVQMGLSPDEKDTDSWTALHYACWYGELEVVKVLVEEASADLGILNNSDSTPLHLAAATGHSKVVAYLLQQPGIQLVQTAIDCEGKSPLAVCLECRQNDWSEVVKLLREAYKKKTPAKIVQHAPFTSRDLHVPSLDSSLIPFQNGVDSLLGSRGSQADLVENTAITDKRNKKLVCRQRVDLTNGQHHLAHFSDGKDTPAAHVLQDIYKLIGLAPQYHNMLALWIQSDSLELQLGDGDKPLLLMSTWSSLLARHGNKKTTSSVEVPRLCVRRNVFTSTTMERSINDPCILELLYADAMRQVLAGRYPCTEEEAVELGGLSMQVLYGDHVPMVHHSGFLRGQLEQVLPVAMATSRRRVEFERRVLTQHSKVSNNISQCDDSQVCFHKMYLQKCWQWPFYGAAFFPGILATKSCRLPMQVKLSRKAHIPVSLAVNTVGFHLIAKDTNSLVVSLSHGSVECDASADRHRVLITKTDKSLHIEIHTKMAGLLYTLVSKMTEQYLQSSHSNTSTTTTGQND